MARMHLLFIGREPTMAMSSMLIEKEQTLIMVSKIAKEKSMELVNLFSNLVLHTKESSGRDPIMVSVS